MSKALLAFVCVAAGAGGTYLVVRSTTPSPAPAQIVATQDPTPTATVEQSEGVVADPPAPIARAETVSRARPSCRGSGGCAGS